jgi:hypothetical protein
MSFWTADRNRASLRYSARVEQMRARLACERARLVDHPVYESIRSVDALYVFMQHHVFAVWDFMSLLKELQRRLSCVQVPWVPIGDPNTRRLVNDIVMSEETDEDGKGGYASHFELYLRSMREAEADTSIIEEFIGRIRRGEGVRRALDRSGAPPAAREFVGKTYDVLESDQTHRIVACFTFGREDVVPDMFLRIVLRLQKQYEGKLSEFIYYLQRHIAVDTSIHGPMAFDMISLMCGDDVSLWREAEDAAIFAIRARVALWDAVREQLDKRPAGALLLNKIG